MTRRFVLFALVTVAGGCAAGAESDPQVRVTVNSISVTSIPAPYENVALHGRIIASTDAYGGEAYLWDLDKESAITIANGATWPTQGIVGQGVVEIPVSDQDGPYEIRVRYDTPANWSGWDTAARISVPYASEMSEQIEFNLSWGGAGLLVKLSFDEL